MRPDPPAPAAPPTAWLADVTLREHGQNVPAHALPAFAPERRAALANDLAAAGFRRLEVFSCVSPRRVPAMAPETMLAVARRLALPPEVLLVTLVPNPRGLESFFDLQDALGANGPPPRHAAGVFFSAVEAHNRLNLGVDLDTSIRWATAIARACRARGIPVVGYVSAALGFRPQPGAPVRCPSPEALRAYVARLRELGAETVTLSDLQGVATPAHTREVISDLLAWLGPGASAWIGYHPHHADPAAAVALAEAAWHAGVRLLDGSLGAAGGCITGAPGNAPTEGLHAMLLQQGARTGIDPDRLAAAARSFEQTLARAVR